MFVIDQEECLKGLRSDAKGKFFMRYSYSRSMTNSQMKAENEEGRAQAEGLGGNMRRDRFGLCL